MISLFGLILVLGIVVDDAIVVGEHAEALKRQGNSALESAERGAKRMAAPVFSSTLTTLAAFLPLFVIDGIIGAIIGAIPMAVCAALIASLFECFLALPGHMKGAHYRHRRRRQQASVHDLTDGSMGSVTARSAAQLPVRSACGI